MVLVRGTSRGMRGAQRRLSFGVTGIFGHTPQDSLAIAVRAEQLGFDRVVIGEHVVAAVGANSTYPYAKKRPVDERSEVYDPFSLAAAIAVRTSRINIMTAVVILPWYNPLLATRAVSTVQQLAAGRFILGVGVGWAEEEYRALQISFQERGKRLDESLQIMRKVLGGGVVEYTGKHYAFAPLSQINQALPVPLLVGGSTEPALKRAARLADGWCGTPDKSPEECIEIRARIEKYRNEYGRGKEPFSFHVRLPEANRTGAERFAAAGFANVTVGSGNVLDRKRSVEQNLQALESMARELGL